MSPASPRAVGGFVCQSCTVLPRSSISPFVHLLGRSSVVIARGRYTKQPPWQKPGCMRWASGVSSSIPIARQETEQAPRDSLARTGHATADPNELAILAEKSNKKFLAIEGVPDKQLTATALQLCLRAAAALHPQLKRAEAQTAAAASRLASLSAERTGTRLPIDARISDAAKRIAAAAWDIISHPNVEMTAEFLETYVQTMNQLGRAESLPAVLDLYAHKSRPVVGADGVVTYKRTNPRAAARAVETHVIDMALHTAIEAKNLDAALGVIEAGYCAPAFRRQKLIKYGTAPAIGLVTMPFGVVGLATGYAAYWQNTMDVTTATGIAIAGISGYLLTVGSLGMIAKLSYKDQMKRVTWTPGTPLRYRWLREEERAALDKVALSWGFKEPWRHGEETGADWEGLREYMGYRQMLLDRVEFMEGMS